MLSASFNSTKTNSSTDASTVSCSQPRSTQPKQAEVWEWQEEEEEEGMAGAGSCSESRGPTEAAVTRRASWEPGERDRDESLSSKARRAVVARSWYGGYGALAEEEEEDTVGGGGGSSPDVRDGRGARHLVMPSLKSLVSMATLSRRRSSSTTALNSPQDAVKMPSARSATALPLLRKCETAVTLPSVRPVNRLRSASGMCSRCSSILSLAGSSRYSINTAGFVAVDGASSASRRQTPVLCKLCLLEVPPHLTWTLQHCACTFCIECMRAYVDFEVNEGAYEISCPDALCEKQGVITMAEIERLVSEDNYEKHKRFRLNREVELDKSRTWCPRAGCETVCTVCAGPEHCQPQSVHCPTCDTDFCSNCRAAWHSNSACRPQDLAQPIPGLTFDSELIKCCPMCAVPIEKDEGCAQMMCKRCKHVFCWYCLASLDDDFLLRHYDKGPCKNKLGHSRASVIWHRTQVIGIFAGFGILLLVASPLLLLAAPCIVCCKCRVCGGSRLDADDADLPDDTAAQQSFTVT